MLQSFKSLPLHLELCWIAIFVNVCPSLAACLSKN